MDNPTDRLLNIMGNMFGSGDIESAFINILMISFVFFNVPTLISIARGRGTVEAVEIFRSSLFYMLAGMTPFTFPMAYMGWWGSLKRSLS